MEERPRLKIMQSSSDHTWEAGIFIAAVVNTVKASPIPDVLYR